MYTCLVTGPASSRWLTTTSPRSRAVRGRGRGQKPPSCTGEQCIVYCTVLYCTVLYCTAQWAPVWSSWCQTMLKMLTVMSGRRMRAAVQLTQAPRPASPRSLASHTTTAVSSP